MRKAFCGRGAGGSEVRLESRGPGLLGRNIAGRVRCKMALGEWLRRIRRGGRCRDRLFAQECRRFLLRRGNRRSREGSRRLPRRSQRRGGGGGFAWRREQGLFEVVCHDPRNARQGGEYPLAVDGNGLEEGETGSVQETVHLLHGQDVGQVPLVELDHQWDLGQFFADRSEVFRKVF